MKSILLLSYDTTEHAYGGIIPVIFQMCNVPASFSAAEMSASSTPISRVHPGWPSSSLKNKGLSPAACSTPLLAAFPGNDDEKERRQRRRSRVIDLQTATEASLNDSASQRCASGLNVGRSSRPLQLL